MPPFLYASALRTLGRRIRSRETENLEWVAVGPCQKEILFLVLEAPGIPQVAVCERLGLHKSVVSRAVAALRTAGHLEPGSTRRGLFPAHMASTLEKHIRQSTDEVERALVQGFSEEDLRRFKRFIQQAAANLDGTAADPNRFVFRNVSAN